MSDGIKIARNGVPVVVLITDQFIEPAAAISAAGGMPDLPVVVLPHPTAGRGGAFLEQTASEATPAITQALKGSH